MKPRTRLHHEVLALHQKLEKPKHQEPYVISKHDFYYTTHYKNLVCLECNHTWKPTQIWHEQVVGVKCPSCNKKLKKIATENGGRVTRVLTYSVIEVVERFQVFRYFSCWKHMDKNKAPYYTFRSLFEEWKDYDKNKKVFIGRTQAFYGDGFSTADYEIRANSLPNRWGAPIYETFGSDITCPGAVYLPRFDKYKLNVFKNDCDPRKLLYQVEMSPKIETLLKSNQKDLLFHAVHKDSHHNTFWPQIKIAFRNKYRVKDAGLWYDYLQNLRYFRKDLRNAKFVCPKNLKEEHDKLMNKKRAILRKQELEREEQARLKRQQNLERAISEYVELFGKFFDLEFKDGDLLITPLKSVEEFKTEGDELNHCVYTNEYYLKNDSLVLSAKIDGKRTETIEFILSKMKVEQCRGMNNQPTKYHDRIVNLVNRSIPKIRQVLKKSKPKKVKEQIQKSA
jgi:hypothetical protein